MALVVKYAEEYSESLLSNCEVILEEILEKRLPVVVDFDGEILDEYGHELERKGQPTLADEFYKYLLQFSWGWDERYRPSLDPDSREEYRYAVLGGDDSEIDPSDRKFVAASKVSGFPVYQATDTKWLDWELVLHRHGVRVVWVDEESLRCAYSNKFNREAPRWS